MTLEDKGRISRNEQVLRETMGITTIAELPNFPFKSLEEVKTAKQAGAISIGTISRPDLLDAFGTLWEIRMSYFWTAMPFITGILFIIVAIAKGNYWYLIGIPSIMLGVLLATPIGKGCANIIIGFAGILLLFFIFNNPVWAWIIAGLYSGHIFARTVREQFRMVMEERALESEILFCHLYLEKVLLVKDKKTGKLI